MEIFTTGYQLWRPEDFAADVRKRGAVVADIRLKPWSKDPAWRAESLAELLGAAAYAGVPDLGNLNYKTGGPVRIQGLEAGIARIASLPANRPVILRCACWNPEACHRTTVARHLRERGYSVTELDTPPRSRGLSGQLDLFG